MLPDFIAANNLQAKILPYRAKGSLIECRLFFAGKLALLAVFQAKDKLSEEKLGKAVKAEGLARAEPWQCEEATGYEQGFLPPISIYGVKVVLDEKLMEREKLRCIVAEEQTLEIRPEEIKKANEDCVAADITS